MAKVSKRKMIKSLTKKPEEAKQKAAVHGVLEVVGNESALSLACDLCRPFGVISSVGALKPGSSKESS